MNSEPLRALLQHRIEQAHETLREAIILQEAAAYRGATNRAYYAMFYAQQFVAAVESYLREQAFI